MLILPIYNWLVLNQDADTLILPQVNIDSVLHKYLCNILFHFPWFFLVSIRFKTSSNLTSIMMSLVVFSLSGLKFDSEFEVASCKTCSLRYKNAFLKAARTTASIFCLLLFKKPVQPDQNNRQTSKYDETHCICRIIF